MKISISNIAWDKKDDKKVYEILKQNHIYGLDVAPARIFDNPFESTEKDGKQFVDMLRDYNLTPVGMQSLLFGTNGLALFEDEEVRRQTIDHLKKMMDYAKRIGVTRLVFGSPKNRLIRNQAKDKIEELSYEIFNELGDYASKCNLYFCIEPNPTVYGGDFITTTKQGIELVKQVNNPGFRLHMDLGTMIINNENIEEVIYQGLEVTEHIHLSHPNLETVMGYEAIHHKLHRAIKANGYKHTISIEMKNSMQENNVQVIKDTVQYISAIYN